MKCPFPHHKSAFQTKESGHLNGAQDFIKSSLMCNVHISENETERLAALKKYNVLDTPPEPAFDEIVQLAAQICNTPVALISLVDEKRQWFKSKVGLDINETPRDISFCTRYTIR